MFKSYALTLVRAVRFCIRNRAPLTDTIEITALAMLALVRCASPTGKMYIGQVRAKARRIRDARGVRHVPAALRAPSLASA